MRKGVLVLWAVLLCGVLGSALYLSSGPTGVPSGAVVGAPFGGSAPHIGGARVGAGASASSQVDAEAPAHNEAQRALKPNADRQQARAGADALRAAILRAQIRAAPTDPAAPSVDPKRAAAPSSLRARAQFDPETLKAVQEQLMPLIDECIDMAHEREGSLEGMLALQVAALGDPDLGAVIDTVRYGERNELGELELLECVRESAWSLSLPAPDKGGRTEFELTIVIEADAKD